MNVRLYDCNGNFVAGASRDANGGGDMGQTYTQSTDVTSTRCAHAQVRFWYDANPHSIYEATTANVGLG